MNQLKCRIPGKLILSGEHSVVYGYPALVSAVGIFADMDFTRHAHSYVQVQLRESKTTHQFACDDLVICWNKAEKVWQELTTTKSHDEWKKIVSDPLVVVKLAFGLLYSDGIISDGVSLRIRSQLPIGSGLGSSAAIAGGVIGGWGALFETGWDREDIYQRTLRVEQIIHARASGVDPLATLYGGLLVFQKKENSYAFEQLGLNDSSESMLLIDSGKPAETTGEMVQLVQRQKQSHPDTYRMIFEQMGRLTSGVVEAFRVGNRSWDFLAENQRLLEKLGVVGQAARHILQTLSREGVMAKICGAGGAQAGSGMILAYHEDRDRLQYVADSLDKPLYKVALEKQGWRVV